MYLNDSELAAILIFLISACKVAWDIWISKSIFKKKSNGKSGERLTVEVKNKRSRDKLATILAFASISILTIWIIIGGSMKEEITRKEFVGLEKRVNKIEDFLDLDGGGPVPIIKKIEQIEAKIEELQQTYASQHDLDELKREVAKLKKQITVQVKAY